MTAPLPTATKRLVLRELEPTDFAAVHEYATDPEVVRFMSWGPNTEEETAKFLERAAALRAADPRDVYELAVEHRSDGRLLGACGIHVSDRRTRRAWLGYCYRRDAWGRGYGTEAARTLVAFGFETLGLHRIFALCATGNVASARVLEKAGMTREGTLRDHGLVRGEWLDAFVYAVLEHEWNPGGG